MHRKTTTLAAALTATALSASAAQAHVTLQPKQAASGAYTVENVRVPNETDDATTTEVRLQLPDGFAEASYQSTPGWKVTVVKDKLATPIQTDDGPVTEGVKEITWKAQSKSDGIAPGQFRDFPLSVQIPGKQGDTLTFKALQTYSDGQVVRWIGPEGSDHPAPTVSVTAADDGHAHATASSASATPSAGSGDNGGDGDSNTLAIVALAVGAIGVAVGGAGFATARRAQAT